MATIAAFSFPPETFLLGRLFDASPDATIEIERVVPVGTGVRPYLWVEDIPDAEIQSLFETAGGIEGLELIDAFEGRSLLRCHCERGDHVPSTSSLAVT